MREEKTKALQERLANEEREKRATRRRAAEQQRCDSLLTVTLHHCSQLQCRRAEEAALLLAARQQEERRVALRAHRDRVAKRQAQERAAAKEQRLVEEEKARKAAEIQAMRDEAEQAAADLAAAERSAAERKTRRRERRKRQKVPRSRKAKTQAQRSSSPAASSDGYSSDSSWVSSRASVETDISGHGARAEVPQLNLASNTSLKREQPVPRHARRKKRPTEQRTKARHHLSKPSKPGAKGKLRRKKRKPRDSDDLRASPTAGDLRSINQMDGVAPDEISRGHGRHASGTQEGQMRGVGDRTNKRSTKSPTTAPASSAKFGSLRHLNPKRRSVPLPGSLGNVIEKPKAVRRRPKQPPQLSELLRGGQVTPTLLAQLSSKSLNVSPSNRKRSLEGWVRGKRGYEVEPCVSDSMLDFIEARLRDGEHSPVRNKAQPSPSPKTRTRLSLFKAPSATFQPPAESPKFLRRGLSDRSGFALAETPEAVRAAARATLESHKLSPPPHQHSGHRSPGFGFGSSLRLAALPPLSHDATNATTVNSSVIASALDVLSPGPDRQHGARPEADSVPDGSTPPLLAPSLLRDGDSDEDDFEDGDFEAFDGEDLVL